VTPKLERSLSNFRFELESITITAIVAFAVMIEKTTSGEIFLKLPAVVMRLNLTTAG
jgi:hypothetical protein